MHKKYKFPCSFKKRVYKTYTSRFTNKVSNKLHQLQVLIRFLRIGDEDDVIDIIVCKKVETGEG